MGGAWEWSVGVCGGWEEGGLRRQSCKVRDPRHTAATVPCIDSPSGLWTLIGENGNPGGITSNPKQ